jgi:hypothetical protein
VEKSEKKKKEVQKQKSKKQKNPIFIPLSGRPPGTHQQFNGARQVVGAL